MGTEPSLPAWLPALLQLSSPALPIGSFSYSQGLEAAQAQGLLHDEASALAWIDSAWRQSFGPRERAAVAEAWTAAAAAVDGAATAGAAAATAAGAAACADTARPLHDARARAARALAGIDARFVASRDAAEARAETRQVGAALQRWLFALLPDAPESALMRAAGGRLSAPVAFALCCRAQGLPCEASVFAWGFAWIENQVQAAVKLVPLGQSAGQRLQLALRARLSDPLPDTPWAFAPVAAILAMRHERQYTRLFRS